MSHWRDVADLFAENLRRFQRGDALRNIVHLIAGYQRDALDNFDQ